MDISSPHHGQNAVVLLSRTYVFTAFSVALLILALDVLLSLSATAPAEYLGTRDGLLSST
jgi:hypothetical protein